jgi:hypothetical protein
MGWTTEANVCVRQRSETPEFTYLPTQRVLGSCPVGKAWNWSRISVSSWGKKVLPSPTCLHGAVLCYRDSVTVYDDLVFELVSVFIKYPRWRWQLQYSTDRLSFKQRSSGKKVLVWFSYVLLLLFVWLLSVGLIRLVHHNHVPRSDLVRSVSYEPPSCVASSSSCYSVSCFP